MGTFRIEVYAPHPDNPRAFTLRDFTATESGRAELVPRVQQMPQHAAPGTFGLVFVVWGEPSHPTVVLVERWRRTSEGHLLRWVVTEKAPS